MFASSEVRQCICNYREIGVTCFQLRTSLEKVSVYFRGIYLYPLTTRSSGLGRRPRDLARPGPRVILAAFVVRPTQAGSWFDRRCSGCARCLELGLRPNAGPLAGLCGRVISGAKTRIASSRRSPQLATRPAAKGRGVVTPLICDREGGAGLVSWAAARARSRSIVFSRAMAPSVLSQRACKVALGSHDTSVVEFELVRLAGYRGF